MDTMWAAIKAAADGAGFDFLNTDGVIESVGNDETKITRTANTVTVAWACGCVLQARRQRYRCLPPERHVPEAHYWGGTSFSILNRCEEHL